MDPHLQPAPGTAPVARRCVGRERELGQLETLFRGVLADGRGRVAWVAGPAGIGKSRLLRELKRRLQPLGAALVEGGAREGGRPYQAALELVEATSRLLVDAGATRLAARGAELSEALKGRPFLVGPEPLRLVRTSGTAAALEAGRAALFERVATYFTEAARLAPLVLFIHDLHAADGATRALVQHLVQTRFPTAEFDAPSPSSSPEDRLPGLLVVSVRDEAVRPELPPWLDGTAATCVGVGPLDEAGLREYLQSPDVIEQLLGLTRGRPDLLDALTEGGLAESGARLGAQLGTLAPTARRLLAALAVHGRPTGPVALRRSAVPDVDDEALARAAGQLVEARLVVKQVVEGELRLAFARRGDAEEVYRSLAEGERLALHTAVGRALLERAEPADRVVAAEHLCRGEPGDEAVEAALAAGQQLEAGFGYDRAIALYRAAHSMSKRPAVQVLLEERMLELKRLVGDYPGALEDAERLHRRRPGDAATLRALGELHLLRDDFARARAALDRSRALAEAAGDQAELVRVLAASAERCLLDGQHEEARRQSESGLAATATAAWPWDAAEAGRLRLELRNTLGKVHLAEGRYQDAGAVFALNLVEARAIGSTFEEARALINEGIAQLRLGDHAAAGERYREALRVADAVGDQRHRAFCLQNLGVLAHWRAEYATALRYFQDGVAAFKRLGQRGRLAWIALDLASLHLDLGGVDRAAAMAALSDRLRSGDPGALVRLKRGVIAGRLARSRAETEAAREAFEAVRTEALATHHHEPFAEATLHLGWLALERGDEAEATRLAGEVLDEGGGEPHRAFSRATRARALALLGESALARDDAAAARRALLEAADTFQRLGDLDGEWRAHLALGRAAAQGRDHAEAERRYRMAELVDGKLRERVPQELRANLADDPARRALLRAAAGDPLRGGAGSAPGDGAPGRSPRPVVAARVVRDTGAEEAGRDRLARIVGGHARMRQLRGLIEKVAQHESVVLIRGESGTGKELVADAIHALSRRSRRALVKVNCAALVETLLLSELFGHERGAFTGAVQRKIGRFEAAHQGTIFLDEIGDISPRTQAALLRVIQEREFERVGSTTPVKVDVRIVCATHRDLEAMVARGEFREDLYYRLKGIQIDVPALRERADDIPQLVGELLSRVSEEHGAPLKSVSPAAMDLLMRHRWPGNVRELENVIRSVSLFAEGATIDVPDLRDYPELGRPGAAVVDGAGASPAAAVAGASPEQAAWQHLGSEGIGLRELQQRIEVECITRALAASRGNITRAAELLKMKRPRLSQLIKEYGIAL